MPNEELHNMELARAILNRESDAEETLVERFSKGLACMLFKRTGNRALSEDLLQETFRLVLQKLRNGEVKEPEKLKGYIYQVARNLLIANHRKEKRWLQAGESQPEPVDLAMSAETRMERHERAQQVRKVIAEMGKARDRELLIRFYVAEEGREQICADMELDSIQLTKILHRARGRFKEIWQKKKSMDLVGG